MMLGTIMAIGRLNGPLITVYGGTLTSVMENLWNLFRLCPQRC
ncbi:unnamed protein product [Arabidopsis halleri]